MIETREYLSFLKGIEGSGRGRERRQEGSLLYCLGEKRCFSPKNIFLHFAIREHAFFKRTIKLYRKEILVKIARRCVP